jgi:hypothetical protein
MRGSALTLPRPAIYAITNPKGLRGEYQVAGADADHVFGSAFAVDRLGGAAQLLSLGHCMNTNAHVLRPESKTRKSPALRPWFLLLSLSVAACIAWLAWPSQSNVSVFELSRADGKPRFWVTTYSKADLSSLTLRQRLYYMWMDYVRRRAKPNPAAYSFSAHRVQPCSLSGLLNQCMETGGTKYLIAVEAAPGTVDFGYTNTLNGAQWVAAFERAITNQPVLCFDFPKHRNFKDELVLIREKPDLVKVVPRTKLVDYQKAGLVKEDQP